VREGTRTTSGHAAQLQGRADKHKGVGGGVERANKHKEVGDFVFLFRARSGEPRPIESHGQTLELDHYCFIKQIVRFEF
jgi:hypothetical protein